MMQIGRITPYAIADGEDGSRSVTFNVKAANYVKVQLQTAEGEEKNMYELRLGERDNTHNRLRRCDAKGECVIVRCCQNLLSAAHRLRYEDLFTQL